MRKVSGPKIEILRGRLIAQLQRNVEWIEFAHLCGVTPNTLANIRKGVSSGSIATCHKIVDGVRTRGLDVDIDALLD